MSIPGTYTSMTTSSSGIQFIGAGGRVVSTITAQSVAHPDTLIGDLVVVIAQFDDSRAASTPSGWTSIARVDNAAVRIQAWYRVYNGTMPTFSINNTDHIILDCLTFRGVNATVQDIAAGSLTNLGYTKVGESPNAVYTWSGTSASTATPNAFILFIIGHEQDTSSPVFTDVTAPSLSNVTKLTDISTTTGFNGGFVAWGGIKDTVGSGGLYSASQTIQPANSTVPVLRVVLRAA